MLIDAGAAWGSLPWGGLGLTALGRPQTDCSHGTAFEGVNLSGTVSKAVPLEGAVRGSKDNSLAPAKKWQGRWKLVIHIYSLLSRHPLSPFLCHSNTPSAVCHLFTFQFQIQISRDWKVCKVSHREVGSAAPRTCRTYKLLQRQHMAM